MYGDRGIRTIIISDIIIERIESTVVTTYDGADLHIHTINRREGYRITTGS